MAALLAKLVAITLTTVWPVSTITASPRVSESYTGIRTHKSGTSPATKSRHRIRSPRPLHPLMIHEPGPGTK